MKDGAPDAFRAFEQAGWERAASVYAEVWTRLTDQCRAALLDAAAVARGTRLLDVACGPGRLIAAALERGAIVTGLDFAAAMLTTARAAAPGAELRRGDAEALPFDDGSFDAVTCGFGVPHFAAPERAMAEAHRVLRPGGRFAYSMWCPPDQAVGFGMMLDAVKEHGTLDVGLPEGPPMFRYGDAAISHTAMDAAGFADVRINQVAMSLRLGPGESLADAFLEGTVRTAGLLRAQQPDALERIRRTVAARVAAYPDAARAADRSGGLGAGGAAVLPMPCWVVSGRKA